MPNDRNVDPRLAGKWRRLPHRRVCVCVSGHHRSSARRPGCREPLDECGRNDYRAPINWARGVASYTSASDTRGQIIETSSMRCTIPRNSVSAHTSSSLVHPTRRLHSTTPRDATKCCQNARVWGLAIFQESDSWIYESNKKSSRPFNFELDGRKILGCWNWKYNLVRTS